MDLSRTAEYGTERRLDGGYEERRLEGGYEGTLQRTGGDRAGSPVLLMAQMGHKRLEEEDGTEDGPRTGHNLSLLYNKVTLYCSVVSLLSLSLQEGHFHGKDL